MIVGEKSGSKLTKAQQLGVTILTKWEFESMSAWAKVTGSYKTETGQCVYTAPFSWNGGMRQ